MRLNKKIGYLAILLTLATTANSTLEDKDISSSSSISKRLVNVHNKLQENKQKISQFNPDEIDTELLAIFEDFADSFPFSDFSDIPIFEPGFTDFDDSFPFSDFADLW